MFVRNMTFCLITASSLLLLAPLATHAVAVVTIGGPWEQFVVTGPKLGTLLPASLVSTNANRTLLDPAMVAVCCDRIKQAILREFNMRDEWRGKIFVNLQPRWKPDAQIVVTSAFSAGRWSYWIEIPNEVGRDRFLRVMVQVLLLEMANRNAGARQAEVPFWLTEGITGHLQATALSSLLLEPETKIASSQMRRDPWAEARKLLQARTPLTVDELSWPKAGQLDGESGRFYQSCAQLFLTELLRLKNAPAGIKDMLSLLPQYLNWQTAFLRAFGAHFSRLIDVEKWWSLKLVQFTGREPAQTWTRLESLEQLEEVLATPAHVRSSRSQLPSAANVPLQTVIGDWTSQRQLPLLRQKISQLQLLRPRVSHDLVLLVDAYRLMLDAYVQKRSNVGAGPSEKSHPPSSPKVLVRETLKQLSALDARRELLRQQKENKTVVQSAANP
ncbi:MAG: hypothetical protein DME26_00540 [Verrucomicrobia bacterium]|nr:MAG: hypothetical protein DME26_00540 [Verrucomicrobiota bacterium]